MKRIVPSLIILLSVLAIIVGYNYDRRGNVFSTGTHSLNDKPLLRVVGHYERFCFGVNCGTIYVFQAHHNGEWREITDFRQDWGEGANFNSRNVRIINENVFYFNFGWKYGVTTDGGKTWSIWDAEKNLPDWRCCNYRLIENVEIEESGKGKMNLNVIAGRGEIPFLYTEDFGKTWRR